MHSCPGAKYDATDRTRWRPPRYRHYLLPRVDESRIPPAEPQSRKPTSRAPDSPIWTATVNLERVMGIEPTSSAWKAEVLPLNYTRETFCRNSPITRGRIRPDPRTLVEGVGFEPTKAEPPDLQSGPFGRSGTPPKRKRRILLNGTRRVKKKTTEGTVSGRSERRTPAPANPGPATRRERRGQCEHFTDSRSEGADRTVFAAVNR